MMAMPNVAAAEDVHERTKVPRFCGCEDCALRLGTALFRTFNGFGSTRAIRVKHTRVMPPVVVEIGRLAGVIYRSDKGRRGSPQTYIHFMEKPPRLVSNVEGTQLYIVGGRYRVGARGIEG